MNRTPFACIAEPVLPEPANVVVVEYVIVSNDGYVFELGLRDQHPIEWIPVIPCEVSSPLRVKQRDIKGGEALTRNTTGNVGRHFHGARKLPEPGFRGDLPS
jgi:hypothetical protein